MTTPTSKPRRFGWLAVAVVAVAALVAWAISVRTGSDDPDATTPRTASASSAVSGSPGKTNVQLLDKPLWHELTHPQQVALEPLRPEWDAMDGARKKKWLEMSRRFASMTPAEQARVHERMRQWIRLTPEQRNLARENYNKARKLAPGEKAATWESYKQLSPDQRQRLAQSVRKNAAGGTPPAPGTIVAPISCPAGTTRRGASCISLQAPAAIPGTPAITQPAPATPAPSAPANTAPASAAPTVTNTNG